MKPIFSLTEDQSENGGQNRWKFENFMGVKQYLSSPPLFFTYECMDTSGCPSCLTTDLALLVFFPTALKRCDGCEGIMVDIYKYMRARLKGFKKILRVRT